MKIKSFTTKNPSKNLFLSKPFALFSKRLQFSFGSFFHRLFSPKKEHRQPISTNTPLLLIKQNIRRKRKNPESLFSFLGSYGISKLLVNPLKIRDRPVPHSSSFSKKKETTQRRASKSQKFLRLHKLRPSFGAKRRAKNYPSHQPLL